MMKRLVIALALSTFAVTSAFAGDPPANKEQCLDQAFKLAESAEGKKLSDDKLETLEKQLTEMETACDAEKFADAAKVAGEISDQIGN